MKQENDTLARLKANIDAKLRHAFAHIPFKGQFAYITGQAVNFIV